MGLSTIGGIFTESIIRKMGDFNEKPIIFPLSNPSDKSECTFEQAMEWTDDRALFASGSPFPTYTSKKTGISYDPGQGKKGSLQYMLMNAYLLPA